VKLTERAANTACTSKTGLSAALRGLLDINGTHAGARALDLTKRTGASTRRLLTTLTCLCPLLTVAALAGFSSSAEAAVTHVYDAGVSEALAAGVPAGCVATAPPCLSGPLTGGTSLAVSGSSVWVADVVQGGARIDRFDTSTGVFEGPQIDEAAQGEFLGGSIAVGHGFSGEQVYANSKAGLAVFDGATGARLGTWTGERTKPGNLGKPERFVAVDGSGSPDSGDVYVLVEEPGGSLAVDVFDPEESGVVAGHEPAGVVAELKGTCPAALPGAVCTPAEQEANPFSRLGRIAVSPVNGDVLVEDGSVVDMFEPLGLPGEYSFVRQIAEARPGVGFSDLSGIAVGGEGDIYLAQPEGGGNPNPNAVDELSEAGGFVTQLSGTPTGLAGALVPFGAVNGVAVDPSSGDVFVGGGSGGPVSAFGPKVTVPDVGVAEASGVHSLRVVLHGSVKLDKAGSAACFFDYGTSREYGKSVPCSPATVSEAEGEPKAVSAEVTGLEPDTTYFYRVRAVNGTGAPSDEAEGFVDQGEVITAGPGLHGEYSTEVASTAASVDATIDPHGVPTSFYVQYVPENAGGTASTNECAPTGPAHCAASSLQALGSVPGDRDVSQRLQELAPSTTYHYRVVILSEVEEGFSATFPEEDETLTTQPSGSGFSLPDGRQWELVSPPDKHGAQIEPSPWFEGWVEQAAANGDAMTYLTGSPTEEHDPGYFNKEQVLATRTPTGWASQDIGLPRVNPSFFSVGRGQEYRFFSEDLSSGIAEEFQEFTSLKGEVFPPDTERSPYLRHNTTCDSTPATCYEPLVTNAPGYADVEPEGTPFEIPSTSEQGEDPRFVDATPDLSHVILDSPLPLKPGLPPTALYEWSADKPYGAEKLQLVSVLPQNEGGTPVPGSVGGPGEGETDARWALSAGGSRVVWDRHNALYLTDMVDGRSVRLDVVQSGAGAGAPSPEFQVANREGTRVLFSDGEVLLEGASPGDLYECEVVVEASGPRCVLRDVAPGAPVLGGVLGASEDGSYVYFVSNAVTGDAGAHGAQSGDCGEIANERCSLYVAHYDAGPRTWGVPHFIATLSGWDYHDWESALYLQPTRVSADGLWLEFMSSRSVTGYDNSDARSGMRDQEVFLYDFAHDRVICASCNPSGARPDGIELGSEPRIIPSEKLWAPTDWFAAIVPGWTPFTLGPALYQSRFLSDGGRLFFDSSDGLVPQAVNSQVDVYEWEPAGVGDCSTGSAGYRSVTGGCIGLISSGSSPDESAFLDASTNGDDVFFMTAEKLVPGDEDSAYDIYDAHVCSSESPCAAGSAAPSSCGTADACRAAPAPQPEVFGAPASATFNGPGNLEPESKPAVVVKKKAVKCKRGFVKGKNGKCVRRRGKKRAKGASHDLRTKS
jgi:hypothetical protein